MKLTFNQADEDALREYLSTDCSSHNPSSKNYLIVFMIGLIIGGVIYAITNPRTEA